MAERQTKKKYNKFSYVWFVKVVQLAGKKKHKRSTIDSHNRLSIAFRFRGKFPFIF